MCLQGFPLKDLKVRDNDPPMLLGTGDRLATWLTYVSFAIIMSITSTPMTVINPKTSCLYIRQALLKSEQVLDHQTLQDIKLSVKPNMGYF